MQTEAEEEGGVEGGEGVAVIEESVVVQGGDRKTWWNDGRLLAWNKNGMCLSMLTFLINTRHDESKQQLDSNKAEVCSESKFGWGSVLSGRSRTGRERQLTTFTKIEHSSLTCSIC